MFRLNVWYSKLGFDGKESTLMDNLGAKPVSISSLTFEVYICRTCWPKLEIKLKVFSHLHLL